jgi:hypothetical protein
MNAKPGDGMAIVAGGTNRKEPPLPPEPRWKTFLMIGFILLCLGVILTLDLFWDMGLSQPEGYRDWSTR